MCFAGAGRDANFSGGKMQENSLHANTQRRSQLCEEGGSGIEAKVIKTPTK